jgi:hypothetical protein
MLDGRAVRPLRRIEDGFRSLFPPFRTMRPAFAAASCGLTPQRADDTIPAWEWEAAVAIKLQYATFMAVILFLTAVVVGVF